ncbi:phosphorylase b kinase regulatory subunit alpha, liver isoform [Plakobranchus ocellatus]|uniref:Phosphorylase b kinase regulatory subunit n=1 Tax=Plakobranchus ocellatus TaxID=259542 RepID=A0AAV3YNH0_9GAST|nr:phosphorylase b kinase regulatory subunit alpha, liver isoform [Plakobranchus ocellatus]
MRSRSNSGIRLDYYQRLVNHSILKYQSPLTGLISGNEKNHSWVRDNVYCIMAVWGLALAYRKTVDLDEDRAKAYELEKAVVHAMRGLLRSMQMQSEKVEQFKRTQSPRDALHAKYSSQSGKTVVGDYEWGHLQIDATSLFLLALAQMTASGVIIIFTLDEVAFIQNLVFYIEAAYRCPDYGIWERGDKTNHGLPELNASSIGMAKAALEAINELDLFGSRGGPASVIHVLPDEAQQCQAILLSMLPRESISKETDAALLTVVGFPAFAVDDPDLIALTRETIKEKLEGPYGCSRFLRDGYKTAREDPRRLHYEPWELMVFEKIECQWPMFFAYLILDGLFNNNKEQVETYSKKLDAVLLRTEDNIPVVPELYAVPRELVEEEYKKPNSQKRIAEGKIPHMWGQSMYILGRLMIEGFLSPGELDPLNRRHVTETKPDVVVQVVLLAEDSMIQDKMALHGIELQTVAEVAPIQIHPARVLSKLYSLLGKNRRMGLSGRASSSDIGLLATSKLYMLRNKILAFVPQLVDGRTFYLGMDMDYLVDDFKNKVDFLRANWKGLGRPILICRLSRNALDNYQHPPNALMATIKKLQSGYISGARVHLGKLSDFLHTSCITKLSFLRDIDDKSGNKDRVMVDQLMSQSHVARQRLLSDATKKVRRNPSFSSTALSIQGIVRRSRSIQIDPEDVQGSSPGSTYSRQSSYTTPLSVSPTSPVAAPGIPSFTYEHAQQQQMPHHLKDRVTDSGLGPDDPCGSPTASPKTMRKTFEAEEADVTELVEQLKQSTSLQEQADIIHYLYINRGPDWDTHMEEDKRVPVKELLVELYEKAGHWKQWWLVRHTAGMLRKRVEDLALAATDLLVRQKQLSVGLPPEQETIITSPLPPDELAAIIYDSCGEDHSTASLTQELLVYLAMFIRTEPHLFDEMLRLRVGLIVQVMASELARTLQCSGDEASDHLLNLSPFEMKTLLHHILSGKEFVINSVPCEVSETKLSVKSLHTKHETNRFARSVRNKNHSQVFRSKSGIIKTVNELPMGATNVISKEQEQEEELTDRQGQWLRRRRLDGSLNRVPKEFYPLLWELLHKCRGLTIKGFALPGSLTREMTKGEFKFALQVEMVLNRIPQPEYRQMMVEAMMVLTTLAQSEGANSSLDMSHVEIEVDHIVQEANNLFIKDLDLPSSVIDSMRAANDICLFLYDLAPSGRFGSMAYMCRALANILNLPKSEDSSIECSVS